MQALEAQYRAVADVLAERDVQRRKGYDETHDDSADPTHWGLVLAASAGVVADLTLNGEEANELYERATRVAATALAWMETMLRLDAVDR